jgi:hypothetical protein
MSFVFCSCCGEADFASQDPSIHPLSHKISLQCALGLRSCRTQIPLLKILTQPQSSTTKDTEFHRKRYVQRNAESTWKERPKVNRKNELTWPAHMLICPSHVLSHALVTLPDAPAKIKRGGHFGVLTGMRIFQPRTVHRATNSGKPQVKIRLAFHFVERNNYNALISGPCCVLCIFCYPTLTARNNFDRAVSTPTN